MFLNLQADFMKEIATEKCCNISLIKINWRSYKLRFRLFVLFVSKKNSINTSFPDLH